MKNLLAKKVKKNNKGFTLVELIIVIAIIAILVAVLAPNYVKYVERSRWSADQNTTKELLGEVKTALVAAQDDDSYTPSDFTLTMSKNGTTETKAMPAAVKKALNDADKDWQKAAVKHKQVHTLSDGGKTTTVPASSDYVITYYAASDSVIGSWSGVSTK